MFPWQKEWLLEIEYVEKIRKRLKANRYYSTEHGKKMHKASNKRFLEKNPGYLKQWRSANPDKVKEYNRKRMIRKRNIEL